MKEFFRLSGRVERHKDTMQWWEIESRSSEYSSSHGVTPEFFYLSHIKVAQSLWNISGEEITRLSGFQRFTSSSRGKICEPALATNDTNCEWGVTAAREGLVPSAHAKSLWSKSWGVSVWIYCGPIMAVSRFNKSTLVASFQQYASFVWNKWYKCASCPFLYWVYFANDAKIVKELKKSFCVIWPL